MLLVLTVLLIGAGAPLKATLSADAIRAKSQAQLRNSHPIVFQFLLAPQLPARGWTIVRDGLSTMQNDQYRQACAAADASVPPRIDRVTSPVVGGTEIQVEGGCFGASPGAVTLDLSSRDLNLSRNLALQIQSWSANAITARVPSVPGTHHGTALLTVTRPASRIALQMSTLGSAGGTKNLRLKTSVPPALGQQTNVATVDFWPGHVSAAASSDQVTIVSCKEADSIPPSCFDSGHPYKYVFCTAPCAFHSTWYTDRRLQMVHSVNSGADVWRVTHPMGWRVDTVTLKGTSPLSATAQDVGTQSIVTVRWSDVNIGPVSDDATGFNAAYELVITLSALRE
jgi:hypothetical protein